MKISGLQRIEDRYIKLGYYGEKLRKALNNDKEYKKLLTKKRKSFTRKIRVTPDELKKYVLSTDKDIEILNKCKQLEKLNLSEEERISIKMIKSQLEYDWRKPLIEELNRLLNKYKVDI